MGRWLLVIFGVSLLGVAQTRETQVISVDATKQQSFTREPKVAVLVGVAHYPPHSGLGTLQYPERDVDLLGAELSKQGYTVVKLADGDATRGSIQKTLRDAKDLIGHGSESTILFFFSGHGFADKGANYLATFEAIQSELAQTGMSVAKVEELLKETGARRRVLLVDACRVPPGKAVAGGSFEKFSAAEGLEELFSTRFGEMSYEDDVLGSGIFTHFLVKGLQGGAANKDGVITFGSLASYVTDEVSRFSFSSGKPQKPFEDGEHQGDFPLALTTGPIDTGSTSKSMVPSLPPPQLKTPSGVKTKINPKDGQVYVWIPPGQFTMGCSPDDKFCFLGDQPAHSVTIENGFWLGQTEVTQSAYQRITGKNPSNWQDANLPVEQVTQREARNYCSAVGMRLPSEAEWEYAARAGSSSINYGPLDEIAWYKNNSRNRTHEVGQKQPNAFGLYDMTGNVWEWADEDNILRGGAWTDDPVGLRVSHRVTQPTVPRFDNMGFRCAGK